ncbi:MlaD family protein [bacterium]|nr:MlaD family protein [bacterium]
MGRNARYRSSEIKAGVWILISVLILSAFLVGISGAKFWKPVDHYRVHLSYIGGLETGSPVRMGGMLVGKISDVSLLEGGDALELTVEVPQGLPVKAGTTAYLSFVSITSEQHLELNPGAGGAELLTPGDLIQSKEMLELSDVLEKFDTVGDTVQAILHSVHSLLSPQNTARIDSIIEQTNSVLRTVNPRVSEVLTNMNEAAASMDSLLRNISRFVDGADTSFQRLAGSAQVLIAQAGTTLARIDTTAQGANALLTTNSGSLTQALENIRQASYDLHLLSDAVKDNPFLLIRAIPKKERKLQE